MARHRSAAALVEEQHGDRGAMPEHTAAGSDVAHGEHEVAEDEEHDLLPGPPEWLEEYAGWHRQNRNAPNATYLVFYCGHLHDKCTGLGDRVRSSMLLLRLANLYRKVLLLSWDYPVPLWRFLEPNQVDWRYTPDLKSQLHPLNSSFDCGGTLFHNEMLHALFMEGKYADEFRQAKVVRTQLVRDFHMHIAGEPILHFEADHQSYLAYGRHLFSYLFKPTAEVLQHADKVLREVYPGPNGPYPYIAWHWRTGGLVDEPILNRAATTKVEGSSRLHQLLAALSCAHNMSAERGLEPLQRKRMLLITDHNILRKWVAEGELANVVTPQLTVVHSRATDVSDEDMMAGWVDMAMLAQASCLITSHSGFSWAALFMSNATCWMELKTCVHRQRPRFKGFDVK